MNRDLETRASNLRVPESLEASHGSSGEPALHLLTGCVGWHVESLMHAAAELGLNARTVDFRKLTGVLLETTEVEADGQCIAAGDLVLVRTMPRGSLEQVIFRMDALHALRARGVRVVNSPRALEAAIDKYLALVRLSTAGLPVPATIACECADELDAAFERLGRDVVSKPLFGSEGREIVRLQSAADLAVLAQKMRHESRVAYLQRYLPSADGDLRVLVAYGEVLCAMRRRAPAGDWVTNVARGGRGELIEADDEVADLGRRAAVALDCSVAGVDLLRDETGRIWILEVNAVPGWRALAEVSGRDLSREMLERVLLHEELLR